METLEDKLNHLINYILLKAENQHEFLIGHCRSDIKMTNTQEHILMLLAQGQKTNSELAKILNISQAAVTKAVKSLVKLGMLKSRKDEEDGRVTYFELTAEARPIAQEHQEHHEATMRVYREVLADFDVKESQIIDRFLTNLKMKIEE